MIGTGAAILGSAALGLGGAYLSSNAAKDASKAQDRAGRRAEAQFAPFTKLGQGAVTTLGQLFGIGANGQQTGSADFSSFFESPDYKFAFDEGRRALEFSNAAKGQLMSGNNMRDLTEFGQGMATQNYGNYFQRLMQMAGMGANAAGGQAQQIGNQGQAQASGIVGSANAINSGITGAGNNLLMAQMLQNQGNSSAYNNSGGFGNSWTPITI